MNNEPVRRVWPLWLGAFLALGGLWNGGRIAGEEQIAAGGEQLIVSKMMENVGLIAAIARDIWAIARTVANRKRTPRISPPNEQAKSTAAWHQVDEDSTTLRYWNGQKWTNQYTRWDGEQWNPDDQPSRDDHSATERGTDAETASGPMDRLPEESPARPAGDVAEDLRRIKALHDEGILTDNEYETKRQRLADRL